MADRLDKLRNALRQVEIELAALGTLDDATREQLASAAEEIATSLRNRKQTAPTSIPANAESVQDRLADFEASYPQLAGVVTRLLDGLSQLGI